MSATFWQTGLRLSETVQLAEDQRLSMVSSAATGFLTQEAAILSDGIPFDTFDQSAWIQAEGNSRALASSFLTSFAGELGACFSEFSKVINPTGTSVGGVPQVNPATVLPQLYLFMANANASPNTAGFASPPLVNSRGLTRGSASAGAGNVGTGTIYRLTVDRFGFPLEGDFAETLTFLCTADNQSGTLPGQEQFSVQGQPFRDALTWYSAGYGSGLIAPAGVVGVTGDTTTALIQNPSFSQSSGTGGTSSFALTGWTQTSGLPASMQLDTTNYYRACALEGSTPASLELTGSVTITQQIAPNNTAGQLALTAFLNQLAWNGSIGTWSGSFTVAIGSKSWNVSSGASGWQTLRPTINKNLWAQNFEQAGLAVTITITVSSGALRIDDFCWSPFQEVGGKLFWPIGGATNWIVNDSFMIVDSEPNPPAKVQNWIRLMFPGFFLPSAVIPSAPATAMVFSSVGGGGSLTAGIHVWYVSFVTAAGESALGPGVAHEQTAGNGTCNFTSVPTGPAGTTKRGIYRTKFIPSGSNPGVPVATLQSAQPYLVAYINDNVTTTYADTTADASLLYQPGTIGDPVS